MDAIRFDALARALTAGQHRRGMLRVLAGAALGTAFSARTAREAAAACREAGQRCSAAQGCCPGSRCIREFCRCKVTQGFRACDGPGTRCVNTNTNDEHCGNCNAPCPRHHVCEDGSCIDHCEDGERDGDETDIDCGGRRCPKCGLGKACLRNDDCESGLCADGRCVQCKTDAHCAPLAPIAPFCVGNACRQCETDAHCRESGLGRVCIANNCEQCRDNGDCPAAKPVCDRFHVCRAAACPPGSDFCTGSAVQCGSASNCQCRRTMELESRCVAPVLASPCESEPACTSSAQCVAQHGAGALCVVDTGSFCSCTHCQRECAA